MVLVKHPRTLSLIAGKLKRWKDMWIWLILFWLIATDIYAANPYQLGEVDYFHSPQAKSLDKKEDVFDWREPSITADGKTTYYIPPEPMLVLLTNPTPEHARAYLDWQRQKVEKIMKAQEAIDHVLKE